MASRAIWSGNLKIGSASLPIKLYSAAHDQTIHFHILDAKTKNRVKQHMVDSESGKEVPSEEIQKGYEVEPGIFVRLDPEELENLEPKPSRNIEVRHFVPHGHISHLWYDRPYYLGPDDDDANYFALVEALRKQQREGIARWVMRNKEYAGALQPAGDYLALIALKHADEVLSDRDLPAPRGRDLSQKELNMAEELVRALEGEFDIEEFRDEYRDRVLKFVQAKAEGKRPKLQAVPKKSSTKSLADDLSRSLAALKRSKKERKVA